MDYSNYYSYSYEEDVPCSRAERKDGCMLWERRPAGHGLWERTPPAVGGRNSIIFRLFSIIFRRLRRQTLWEGAREPIFRFAVAYPSHVLPICACGARIAQRHRYTLTYRPSVYTD